MKKLSKITRPLQTWKANRARENARKKKDELIQKQLKPKKDITARIKPGDILAFVVLRNEAVRLPYFLDYYRKLGVNHFIFIDNDSDDGLMDVLGSAEDCSVWYTTASYKESKFGVDWGNCLLSRYGSGHWILMLDPDEFLVYPHIESRNLRELVTFLEQEGKESFFSVMLDMYSQTTVDQAAYHVGQDPLEVCPWFDPTGYYQDRRPTYGDWWIRGGVRKRGFFPDNPEQSPALNKTVLVKWKPHYRYIASTHVVWPNHLNNPHFNNHTLAPTGCLLHFKYLSLFRLKVEEEMARKEHYAGSREYVKYLDGLNQNILLWTPVSARFEGWQQCVNLGLMNMGNWF
jgi:hypothetical protein